MSEPGVGVSDEQLDQWTEEIDYFFEVKCGDKGKDFTMGYDDSTAENGLVKLLRWLDEVPAAGDTANE